MTLHLVRLGVEPRGLAEFARSRALPDDDPGYVLHRALRDGFGASGPQPFRLVERPGEPPHLLGYAAVDAAALRAALALAEPGPERVFPADRIEAKSMPDRFAAGHRLGFELRACPVVRTRASDGRRTREIDAFLHRALAAPVDEPLDREHVYVAWLGRHLAAAGAEPLAVRLRAFTLTPLARRTHASPNGRGTTPNGAARRLLASASRGAARRPDALFVGTLQVRDPDAFAVALARGIGRHRAFGFGMLLLRPA